MLVFLDVIIFAFCGVINVVWKGRLYMDMRDVKQEKKAHRNFVKH